MHFIVQYLSHRWQFRIRLPLHNIEIPLASRRGKAQPEHSSSQNSCGHTQFFVPNSLHFGLRASSQVEPCTHR